MSNERASDWVIYIFVLIPILIVMIWGSTCTPARSFGYENCFLGAIGDTVVNGIGVYGFLVVAGGWLIIVPIFIVASVISLKSKMGRVRQGAASRKSLYFSPTALTLYLVVGYLAFAFLSNHPYFRDMV